MMDNKLSSEKISKMTSELSQRWFALFSKATPETLPMVKDELDEIGRQFKELDAVLEACNKNRRNYWDYWEKQGQRSRENKQKTNHWTGQRA